MKRFNLAILPMLAFGAVGVAQAACVGPVVMGNCLSETFVRGYGSNNGYQGSSGQRYDYNLSDPGDRNNYSIDLDAQMRDLRDQGVNTNRQMDQLQGQFGGGVRNDTPSSGNRSGRQ